MSTADREMSDQQSAALAPGGPGPVLVERSERLQELSEKLERATEADDSVPAELMDQYRTLVFSEYFRDRQTLRFGWPDELYIPSEADYRTYWIVPPPDDHRYNDAWAGQTGGGPTSCYARQTDGRIFSFVNISGLNPGYTGWSGVAAPFRPTSSRTVEVGATIDLVNQMRWWYLPGPAAGYSKVSYHARVSLGVWNTDVNNVGWYPASTIASRTILDTSAIGLGGEAITVRRHAFNDLRTKVHLQAGFFHAVAVSFEVQVHGTFLDRSSKPYAKQPGDDIKLWADMAGVVESITIT